MSASSSNFLKRPGGDLVAYKKMDGAQPGVIFLHGLMSDQNGTKALALTAHCARTGQSCIRFDMYGHGESSGRFVDGNISRWAGDAVAVIDDLSDGPQILVGSSMGGWIMLRAAIARPDRVAGLIGIAPGPDFTEDLMWAGFSRAEREQMDREGIVNVQSDYDERPYPIARQLIEDGRKNLLLRDSIPIACPVRLIHGQKDVAVPWQTSMRLAEKLSSADVGIILVKNGDHRLSEPVDIDRLCMVLDEMTRRVSS
jgi:pimeloyl-ACP methyl ester carboxylesterase